MAKPPTRQHSVAVIAPAILMHSSKLTFDPEEDFRVQKMTFARVTKAIDKTTIIYNSHVTLSHIPLEAYDYVVNGKPAIEWIMGAVSGDARQGQRDRQRPE